MNLSNKSNQEDQGKQGNYKEENYVAVQEYTGEGFRLHGSNPKYGEIAEANREQVEEAVEEYFLKNYKTEVKVHNIVSAKFGVIVYVESIGKPHFHSYAIVPIDIKNEKVETNNVWSAEGEIEKGIRSGLYVMAFEEEFKHLDTLLQEIEEKYPVVGMNIKVSEKVKGNGYRTPYYFVGSGFTTMYDIYLENPDIKGEELRELLREKGYKLSETNTISIRFFLEDPDKEPTNELIDKIYEAIKDTEGLPGGRYPIILNGNYIDPEDAIGEMENTLRREFSKEGEY